MKNILTATFALVALFPAVAAAQEADPLPTDLAQSRSIAPDLPAYERGLAPAELTTLPASDPGSNPFTPALSTKGLGLDLVQEEFSERLRWNLSLLARLDIPGDTAVTVQGVDYSDIFDIGYGISGEASLLSWMTPHWGMGGYLSVSWDRMVGSSNVDLFTGEFATFDDQDIVTVAVGGKIVERFGPYFFWEGKMGLGLVHYGSLSFSDVTFPPAVSGLQFFKPVTHGLFEFGGRVGWGSPQLTFDMGIDFRFMGAEARGRDVTSAVDPDFFFDFIFEVGFTARF